MVGECLKFIVVSFQAVSISRWCTSLRRYLIFSRAAHLSILIINKFCYSVPCLYATVLMEVSCRISWHETWLWIVAGCAEGCWGGLWGSPSRVKGTTCRSSWIFVLSVSLTVLYGNKIFHRIFFLGICQKFQG